MSQAQATLLIKIFAVGMGLYMVLSGFKTIKNKYLPEVKGSKDSIVHVMYDHKAYSGNSAVILGIVFILFGIAFALAPWFLPRVLH